MKKIIILMSGILILLLLVAGNFYIKNNANNVNSLQKTTTHKVTITPKPTPEVFVPHRFVFLADTRGDNNGINQPVLAKLFAQIKALKPQPEYVIVGGDMVTGSLLTSTYSSQMKAFKDCISAYYPIDKILPVFGNHEELSITNDLTHERMFGQFFSEFKPTSALAGYNRTAYYVDLGNVRLITLNSYHKGETSRIINTQLSWLKQVSSSSQNKIDFVFVHSPAYPTGLHLGSSLDIYPAQRDKFWQVINNNNVMTLFCGHEHIYARTVVDSSFSSLYTRPVNQIIAGAAGALSPNPPFTSKKGVVVPPTAVYHMSIVDVNKTSTQIQTISIDGKIIDNLTIPNIK